MLAFSSIDAKHLETVEQEKRAQGTECLSVADDIGADDFPKKIVVAMVQCISQTDSIQEPIGIILFIKKME